FNKPMVAAISRTELRRSTIRPSSATAERSRPRLIVFVGQQAMLHGVTHVTKNKKPQGTHAPLLLGTERCVEWLPRIGELFEIGCPWSQGIGTPVQEADRIAVAQ